MSCKSDVFCFAKGLVLSPPLAGAKAGLKTSARTRGVLKASEEQRGCYDNRLGWPWGYPRYRWQ